MGKKIASGNLWKGPNEPPILFNVIFPSFHGRRDFSQAAEAAVERKNEAEIILILSKCTDATVAAKLEQAKAQLGKK